MNHISRRDSRVYDVHEYDRFMFRIDFYYNGQLNLDENNQGPLNSNKNDVDTDLGETAAQNGNKNGHKNETQEYQILRFFSVTNEQADGSDADFTFYSVYIREDKGSTERSSGLLIGWEILSSLGIPWSDNHLIVKYKEDILLKKSFENENQSNELSLAVLQTKHEIVFLVLPSSDFDVTLTEQLGKEATQDIKDIEFTKTKKMSYIRLGKKGKNDADFSKSQYKSILFNI